MDRTAELFADRKKRDQLIETVRICGIDAMESQEHLSRTYKSDGSVLTETDLRINRRLVACITSLYPSAGIVSEEEKTPLRDDRDAYIVIDPIDGTDIYSQGMPSWCVAVGIMDTNLHPVGAVIFAPRWGIGHTRGMLVTRFPGEEPCMDGEALPKKNYHYPPKQIAAASDIHHQLNLSGFNGKVRSFGSSILHALMPAVHSHIDMALITPCYIWDIAPAHAVIDAMGLELMLINGSKLDYRDSLHRKKTEDYAVVGTPEAAAYLLESIGR